MKANIPASNDKHFRFSLNFREVEAMMAQRGVGVVYNTV